MGMVSTLVSIPIRVSIWATVWAIFSSLTSRLLGPCTVRPKPFGKPACANSFLAPSGSNFCVLSAALNPGDPGTTRFSVDSDRPSMTRSRMASRLIAMDRARRTRTSLSGLTGSTAPLLSVRKGDLSRQSANMNTMRCEVLVTRLRLGSLLTRPRSGVGTFSMACTSPASSAARRVEGLAMKRIVVVAQGVLLGPLY